MYLIHTVFLCAFCRQKEIFVCSSVYYDWIMLITFIIILNTFHAQEYFFCWINNAKTVLRSHARINMRADFFRLAFKSDWEKQNVDFHYDMNVLVHAKWTSIQWNGSTTATRLAPFRPIKPFFTPIKTDAKYTTIPIKSQAMAFFHCSLIILF